MPDRIGELASMEGYSPQEADFQFGVRATPWFGEFAQQHGEPNLNDPNYDYRAAWAAGARPNVRDPGDNQYHWPSQFKGPEHPNRFVNGVDTITGQPVSTGEEYAGLGGDPRTSREHHQRLVDAAEKLVRQGESREPEKRRSIPARRHGRDSTATGNRHDRGAGFGGRIWWR